MDKGGFLRDRGELGAPCTRTRFSDRSMPFGHSGASSRTTSSTSTAPGTSAAASSSAAAPSWGCRCRCVGFLASACGSGDDGGGGNGGTPATQEDVKVTPGGTFRSGLQLPGSDLDPVIVNNQGALGTLGPVRRVPDLLRPRRHAGAAARRELGAERRRLEVDVQDQAGRQVPGRQADDGGGRRGDVQPARRPRHRLQRALGVHRRPLQGRRPGDRRDDGGVRARSAERQLPVHDVLGQLQPDHPAEGLRSLDLVEDVHGHRPVEDGEVHAQRGRDLHEEPRLLGQDPPAPARPQRDQVLRAGGGRAPRHPGRRDRPARAVLRGQRQGAAHRSQHQRDRAARRAAPPAAHAHRQGAVQRQARAPGGGAPDQPRQRRQGTARGEGRLRQRQPVGARLQDDRHLRPPAQAGRREGQGAAGRGRQGELQRRAAHVARVRGARSTPRWSRTTSRRRASTSSST